MSALNQQSGIPYNNLFWYDLVPYDRKYIRDYARRIRKIRKHSLREHARYTSVSKSTLHRMETRGSVGWYPVALYLTETKAKHEHWREIFGKTIADILYYQFVTVFEESN